MDIFFFFNDTATTEIYTLSLHDALPISRDGGGGSDRGRARAGGPDARHRASGDRKSTRLNSSHVRISYAVFCLKKKKRPRPPRCQTRRLPRSAARGRRQPPQSATVARPP